MDQNSVMQSAVFLSSIHSKMKHIYIYYITTFYIICVSTYRRIYNLPTYLPSYLPVSLYLSIYLPIYVFVYLSVYLSIYLSIHPSIDPCIHPSILLSVCLHIFFCILFLFLTFVLPSQSSQFIDWNLPRLWVYPFLILGTPKL